MNEPTIVDLATLVHRSNGNDIDSWNELERRLQPYVDAWGSKVQSTPCGTCGWHFVDIDITSWEVCLQSCCSMEQSGIFKDGEIIVYLDDLLEGKKSS